MDKVKQYIKAHEEDLAVDKISEEVWDHVLASVQAERSAGFAKTKSLPLKALMKFPLSGRRKNKHSHSLKRISRRSAWTFAIILPIAFLFSCTYKVNKVEQVGSIVSFTIDKENISPQAPGFLQKIIGAGSVRMNDAAGKVVSYVSYIDGGKEQAARIRTELERLPFISFLKLTPVTAIITESLFSSLVYKAFSVHVDKKKAARNEVAKNIKEQLQKTGYGNINVSLDKEGVDLMLDSASVAPVPQLPVIDSSINALSKETTNQLKSANSGKKQKLYYPQGKWTGHLEGESLYIMYYQPDSLTQGKQRWTHPQQYRLGDKAISYFGKTKLESSITYSIKADAGVAAFKIILLNTNGKDDQMVQDAIGSYHFEENIQFRQYLEQNGFKNPDEDLMLLLFAAKANREFVQKLKEKRITNALQLARYLKMIVKQQEKLLNPKQKT